MFHSLYVTVTCLSHDTQDLWGDVEISWNHVEFEVRYECLSEEIKIGELNGSLSDPCENICVFCRRLLPQTSAG